MQEIQKKKHVHNSATFADLKTHYSFYIFLLLDAYRSDEIIDKIELLVEYLSRTITCLNAHRIKGFNSE
jgi:hypothetical protein